MDIQTTTVDLGHADHGLDAGCRDCGSSGRHGSAQGSWHAGSGHGGCGCGGGCEGGCGTPALERPRWFAGQLVGPADLEALQDWVIGRARRHNRMIHGWGVSCGLGVQPTLGPDGAPVPWSVRVGAGFALSACGDDIAVPADVRVDIREPRPSGAEDCAPPVDPWCAPVRERREPGRTYYLAVRYAEERRRPVRGSGCSCGCDDDPCEYSRIAESYVLAVLDELPDCYDRAPRDANDGGQGTEASRSGVSCTPELRERGTRPCPDCCSPWVVLADLTVSASGAVEVDQQTHRRFVAQLGELAFFCAPAREQRRPGFTTVERSVLATVFADAERQVVDSDLRESVLTAPARWLRGADDDRALGKLFADRTVAEIARDDVTVLRTAAAASGADPDAAERLIEAARVAVRLAAS